MPSSKGVMSSMEQNLPLLMNEPARALCVQKDDDDGDEEEDEEDDDDEDDDDEAEAAANAAFEAAVAGGRAVGGVAGGADEDDDDDLDDDEEDDGVRTEMPAPMPALSRQNFQELMPCCLSLLQVRDADRACMLKRRLVRLLARCVVPPSCAPGACTAIGRAGCQGIA